jgi:hypothetical protein
MKRQGVFITFLLLIAHSASAWDGVVEGRIDAFEVTGGNNWEC